MEKGKNQDTEQVKCWKKKSGLEWIPCDFHLFNELKQSSCKTLQIQYTMLLKNDIIFIVN